MKSKYKWDAGIVGQNPFLKVLKEAVTCAQILKMLCMPVFV